MHGLGPTRRHQILIHLAGGLVSVATLFTVPVFICSRGANTWLQGDRDAQLALARGVERTVFGTSLSRSNFRTGSSQFNGEWLFGTYQMAAIGYAQIVMQHGELRNEIQPLAKRSIEGLLSVDVRAFDRAAWGSDPVESLNSREDHAAYLGYLNFALGLYRLAFEDDSFTDLNDRITAHLIGRLSVSHIGLLQSYPGEVYPVDNCFVIGSIGLHARTAGQDHAAVLSAWSQRVRGSYIDQETGVLIQAVNPVTGKWIDAPRGSGTAFGLIPLHYADPDLARDLYAALKQSLASTWLGFGAVREYAGSHEGNGDIDSGPIVFGYGMSATGFSIAGAKRYGDDAYFKRLYATARLCGAPRRHAGRIEYISGGPLGNAILFAMLTTPPEGARP